MGQKSQIWGNWNVIYKHSHCFGRHLLHKGKVHLNCGALHYFVLGMQSTSSVCVGRERERKEGGREREGEIEIRGPLLHGH